MPTLPSTSLRIMLVTSIFTATTLSACASKPDRKGPPPEDRRANHKPRSSGTFLHSIAAVFITMDTNKDKTTSRTELSQGIDSEWSGFSGKLSAVNFTPWVIENLGSVDATPNFMNFDQDFNGVITKDEFSQSLEQKFNQLDKDKDGNLTRSEMVIAFAAPQGQRSGRRGQDSRPQREGRGGKGRGQ